jgi:hypothetical protein
MIRCELSVCFPSIDVAAEKVENIIECHMRYWQRSEYREESVEAVNFSCDQIILKNNLSLFVVDILAETSDWTSLSFINRCQNRDLSINLFTTGSMLE